ncbi:hypothetical protein AGR3A_pa10074 [Agrobacterium tomkonis CFBP 6623]|uniref:Uncharacterized protein n=1 Tax=Agrobacterium tomkonis CFBP 6623 TaxID=1183432 RepID=A0A1S7S8S4_9HYPH|nr:hypothetical protein AGR3A_pa10074 [Agrobacterium tomkonis CFBP 6623]
MRSATKRHPSLDLSVSSLYYLRCRNAALSDSNVKSGINAKDEAIHYGGRPVVFPLIEIESRPIHSE